MDPVGLLGRMVGIRSVFPDEEELAHFLSRELESAGFAVTHQRFGGGKRVNVLAERGLERSGEPPVLLYGHMDTVPPYGYEGSGRDPFRLEESGGKLFGLGAYDMKAGICAIVEAAKATKGSGRPLKAMFVSDEEADSRGCFEAAKSGFLRGCAFALAAEISDVHDIEGRTRTITLGRRGRVQLEIRVPGKSFHAARASEGVSAVTEAARIAVEIERMNETLPAHPRLGRGHMFVRSFQSASESLSLPDSATLLVDRHLVPPEDAESARKDVEARVRALYGAGALRGADGKIAEVRVVPREVPYLMPYATPEGHPMVRSLADAVEGALGVKAGFNYGLSVADENLIAMHGVPVASLGPIGGGEHSSGEWVSKRSCIELAETYARYLSRGKD